MQCTKCGRRPASDKKGTGIAPVPEALHADDLAVGQTQRPSAWTYPLMHDELGIESPDTSRCAELGATRDDVGEVTEASEHAARAKEARANATTAIGRRDMGAISI